MRLMPGSRSNIEVRVPSLSHEVEVDIIKDNPGGSGITIFLHVLVNTCGRAYTLEMLQKNGSNNTKKTFGAIYSTLEESIPIGCPKQWDHFKPIGKLKFQHSVKDNFYVGQVLLGILHITNRELALKIC